MEESEEEGSDDKTLVKTRRSAKGYFRGQSEKNRQRGDLIRVFPPDNERYGSFIEVKKLTRDIDSLGEVGCCDKPVLGLYTRLT